MTTDASRLALLLADIIASASDGELTAEQVLTAGCSLPALGITSLAQIRLIDVIENTLGIDIEPDNEVFYSGDVHVLADYLAGHGFQPPPCAASGPTQL